MICAYCMEDHKGTGEHVFPNALLQLHPDATHVFLGEEKAYKQSANKHVVKDVCATCNNELLGDLDVYGLEFFKKNFQKKLHPEQSILVDYDYTLLSKWLIKIIYNCCRSYQNQEHPWFRDNSLFMIGKSSKTTSPFSILGGFYVDMAPIKFFDRTFYLQKEPQFVYGENSREKSEFYEFPNTQVKYLLKLGNAMFVLFVWDNNATEKIIKHNTEILSRIFPYKLFDPNESRVEISRVTDSVNSNLTQLIFSRFLMNHHDFAFEY